MTRIAALSLAVLLAALVTPSLTVPTAAALEAASGAGLKRTGRIQALGPTGRPGDLYDGGVRSPKSAAFSPDGRKLYINALEGGQTLVYAFPSLKRLAAITHAFDTGDAALFQRFLH